MKIVSIEPKRGKLWPSHSKPNTHPTNQVRDQKSKTRKIRLTKNMTRMVRNDGMKPHLAKEKLFAQRRKNFSDEGLGLEPINRGLQPHSTHSLNSHV